MTNLGGPGVGCSAMRIRRLAAGELAAEERARTEEHLARCARCREVDREIARERDQLAAELPFETLAAGVAERLARAPARAPRRGPIRLHVGVALAAGIAFAVAVPAVIRVARSGSEGVRTKGGAEITVWVREDGATRALAAGEPVPTTAVLRIGVSPAAHRYVAVALLDSDGAVVLHAGEAQAGILSGAFEWTGVGEGTLVAVLDDIPIDAEALTRRLARAGPSAAAPRPRAEVIVRPLRRGGP